MPTYIGIGFITSFDFLYNIGKEINIDKYSVLYNKEKIVNFLKQKYKLETLYIICNSDIYNIAVFSEIIKVADPFCSIDFPKNNYNIAENFEEMRDKLEPDKRIEMIVYYANEYLKL